MNELLHNENRSPQLIHDLAKVQVRDITDAQQVARRVVQDLPLSVQHQAMESLLVFLQSEPGPIHGGDLGKYAKVVGMMVRKLETKDIPATLMDCLPIDATTEFEVLLRMNFYIPCSATYWLELFKARFLNKVGGNFGLLTKAQLLYEEWAEMEMNARPLQGTLLRPHQLACGLFRLALRHVGISDGNLVDMMWATQATAHELNSNAIQLMLQMPDILQLPDDFVLNFTI